MSCRRCPWTADAIRLLQGLGYVGHARVQLKIDPRDGVAKLMEINCRPGFRIWCELAVGQPVPLLCVQIHRGLPVDPMPPHAGPDVFLNPIEDAVSLVARLLDWTRRQIVPGREERTLERQPSPREILRQYRETYRAPRKHFDWYFRALADDPVAALSWYASHLMGARASHPGGDGGPGLRSEWHGENPGAPSVGWSGPCALVLAPPVSARLLRRPEEDHAGFYRNKTIRIVVNPTGGGFDAHARTVARHLGRHIPGHPSVVVESMHGAGGLVAVNHLSKAARPDGLTIAHFSGDLLLGEVLGRPGIEFDARNSSTWVRGRAS